MTVTGKGLYLVDSASKTYAGIYDNGSNLWIGATSSTGQHHKGGTYISAGHDGTNGNKSIYISIPTNGNASTTHTSYALVYKDATGSATGPIYVDANGKTVACTTYANATVGKADRWTTDRTFTVGATGKTVNGTGNVSWSMNEIMGSSDSTKFYRGDKTWSNTLTDGLGVYTSTAGNNGYTGSGSAIEIREVATVTTNQNAWTYAPKLGFHWGGRYQGTLGLHSDGEFYFGLSGSKANATVNTGQLNANGPVEISQPDDHRDNGVYGTYKYTKAATIWSMGSAYRIAADGSGLGNLYGAAYGYSSEAYLGSKALAGGHQFIWCNNGDAKVALGNGIWTKGTITLDKDAQICFYGKNNNTSPAAYIGYRASVTGVMHCKNTYGADGAFYIWSNGYNSGNDNGGIAIDNEGVTVFGAGDAGDNFTGIFRVINEDDVASGPVFTVKKAGACYFGKGQGYYISNDGSSYTGNAATATKLATARAINGTNFDGSAAITTANWGTTRALTIGGTAKNVNGSGNVSWSKAEILGSSTNANFYRGDQTWSNTLNGAFTANGTIYANGGLLKSTANSVTVNIGPQNSSWCHFTGAPKYYFDNAIHAVTGFTVYNTGTYLQNNTLAFAQGGGWNMSDSTWIRSSGSKPVYISARLYTPIVAINADSTSYNLYVNGTGRFNNTCYFGNGTTYYINSSGSGNLNALTVNATTASSSTGTGALIVKGGIGAAGKIYGSQVYNAVWNDYAECRQVEIEEPGYCVTETESGKMIKTYKRLQAGCKLTSDTYGTCMGETEEAKTPIAVAGRVLAYPYRARKEYTLGAAVCSAPNGTVDIMTRDEIMMYPERIVGTVSEIPTYEIWSGGTKENPNNIQVKGRIWIYVR